jgi:hypothetical protein
MSNFNTISSSMIKFNELLLTNHDKTCRIQLSEPFTGINSLFKETKDNFQKFYSNLSETLNVNL